MLYYIACCTFPLVINLLVLRPMYNSKNELDHHPEEEQPPLGELVLTISHIFVVTGSSRVYKMCLHLEGTCTSDNTWTQANCLHLFFVNYGSGSQLI